MDNVFEPSRLSDAALVERVREGRGEAFAELFSRHYSSAVALARTITDRSTAEDVVAEAFEKLLQRIRAGGGPDSAFRPYLLQTVRTVAVDHARRSRRLVVVEDPELSAGGSAVADDSLFDTVYEKTTLARAFARLPERWQTFLWLSCVEGADRAEIARILGINPGGVSALGYRARDGLRRAYLGAHLGDAPTDACADVWPLLAGEVQGGLSEIQRRRVAAHIDICDHCREAVIELEAIGSRLGALLAPLVLGAAAPAYLQALGSGGAAASGATTVAGVGGATSGSASGSAAGAASGTASAGAATTQAGGSLLQTALAGLGQVGGLALGAGTAVATGAIVTGVALAVGWGPSGRQAAEPPALAASIAITDETASEGAPDPVGPSRPRGATVSSSGAEAPTSMPSTGSAGPTTAPTTGPTTGPSTGPSTVPASPTPTSTMTALPTTTPTRGPTPSPTPTLSPTPGSPRPTPTPSPTLATLEPSGSASPGFSPTTSPTSSPTSDPDQVDVAVGPLLWWAGQSHRAEVGIPVMTSRTAALEIVVTVDGLTGVEILRRAPFGSWSCARVDEFTAAADDRTTLVCTLPESGRAGPTLQMLGLGLDFRGGGRLTAVVSPLPPFVDTDPSDNTATVDLPEAD